MKTVKTVLLVVAASVIGVIAFAYSGIYDVSATSQHNGLMNWVLSTTSHASVERRAMSIGVPDLADDSLVLAGINDFDSMCVGCHGAPGKSPEAMGQGLNPPAPDLAEEAAEMSPAELFWVTRNGIKMTGMPAWGVTHDDDSIWSVVAFMTRLPALDADGYQALLSSAAGHGHHADVEATEDQSRSDDADASDSNVHVHDDGSEHLHQEAAGPDDSVSDESVEHEHNQR